MSYATLLDDAQQAALRFLDSLSSRPVRAQADVEALRAALGGPLPERGEAAREVLTALVRDVEPGLVASAGPRYFGFVTGGALPVALAADWLTATWDQNAFGFVLSPAAGVVEEVCAGWLLELLGLPAAASVGFVTGGQMANFVCLSAGRNEVLRRIGVDVEEQGLAAGPPVRVLVGEQGHATIHSALRMLGIGKRQVVSVASDAQGRMRADALATALRSESAPTIVCAQAGNVNTGASDPLAELVALARERGAWLHVDGAFGLWAAANPTLRAQLRGHDGADSWAVDGHKWLNVPYDSGFAIVADARAHYDAMRTTAAPYLVRGERGERDGSDWAPESSRRSRAFAVYAALRTLGRSGVAELVGRCCELARRLAAGLEAQGAVLLNEVVLNQVLVRFERPGSDPREGDALTAAVIERVQQEGVCWAGPSSSAGRVALRLSVCNWATDERDIDRSLASIASALASLG